MNLNYKHFDQKTGKNWSLSCMKVNLLLMKMGVIFSIKIEFLLNDLQFLIKKLYFSFYTCHHLIIPYRVPFHRTLWKANKDEHLNFKSSQPVMKAIKRTLISKNLTLSLSLELYFDSKIRHPSSWWLQFVSLSIWIRKRLLLKFAKLPKCFLNTVLRLNFFNFYY